MLPVLLAIATATTALGPTSTATEAPDAHLGVEWLVLPIVQFNDDAGFIYGLHFPLIDYGDGDAKPYRWALELKLRHSTRNRHEHYLWLDLQDVLGLRVTARATFLRIADANYFGIADTRVLADPTAKTYHYLLTEPRVQLHVSQRFSGDFVWGAGLGLSETSTELDPTSQLARERPLGVDGGRALQLLATLAYDTRDDELVPTEGTYVELYAKLAPALLGSTFTFGGAGLAAHAYASPLAHLVFAQRLLAETLAGDVPFYELGRIGGSTNVFGLGGVFTQRGVLESRAIGRHKLLSNSEVRYYFPTLFRRITLGLGAFVDVSLVLDDATARELGRRLRPSAGGELSVKWKDLVLFRVDVGASAEGPLIYVEGRHLF